MLQKSQKFLYFLVFMGILQLIIFYFYANSQSEIQKSRPKDKTSIFKFVDAKNDYLNVCVLPEYDFLDPTIKDFYDPDFNSRKNCYTPEKLTDLENGEWRITVDGKNCSARCITDNGDQTKPTIGKWIPPGPVNCEILEAVCWEGELQIYGFLHTQIVPKKPKFPRKFENQSNVFMIILDSTSTGSAHRMLPKSLKFLSEELEAVEFPYVNRVGENSQSNGIPLIFGKQTEPVSNAKYGGIDEKEDWKIEKMCPIPVDNQTNLYEEFRNFGYMTMDHETMVNYPDCAGFSSPPTDHHLHSFESILEDYGEMITKQHLSSDKCREMHHVDFEYLQKFIDAYPDQPKFSVLWMSDLSHDFFNGLAKFDSFFIKFLKKNLEVLSTSFLFILGDHGLRLVNQQGMENTELFNFEKNNPFLTISIPQKYRKNSGILEKMRENSRQLQTHFDTRATVLDVLKYQPLSSFSSTSLLKIPNERGNSLLRTQPNHPRTCGRLPIPNGYCICRIQREQVNDPLLLKKYGRGLISHVNSQLELSNVTSKCHLHQFSMTTSLIRLSRGNFEVSVLAKEPSHAHFQSTVFDDNKGKLVYGGVTRLDVYGRKGFCVKTSELERLCHCKNYRE